METKRPSFGRFDGFHHIVLWVSNAKQAASYYVTRFGFTEIAYRGLETGDREYCSHVLRQDKIFIILKAPLNPDEKVINEHLAKHGDGVKDVAFTCENVQAVFDYAMKNGAEVVKAPYVEEDKFGKVIMASIRTVLCSLMFAFYGCLVRGHCPHFGPT
jgi:4-hydroxyphenylpyruvate dioxygenase